MATIQAAPDTGVTPPHQLLLLLLKPHYLILSVTWGECIVASRVIGDP